ncbi:MAG: hypothetical protein BHW01_04540 [Clostridium sp. 27_14]|nr:MAG: hypothetical protein BHW01_04540 [Clostridium sp. 27_14]
MSRSGIVNVSMVITEEKILSNIDKVQKLINPNSKKQIVQLEEDTYFKDLVESIKTYLNEYPKKKNFPSSVYNAAYGLVEYATNQFEENTKKIEELIRQREQNIALAGQLKELIETVQNKEEDWKEQVKEAEDTFSEDITETLMVLGKTKTETSQNYQDAMKLLHARVNNLESNLHIEIDMERIEDRSKALSYIGIEVADALKSIPTPVDITEQETVVEQTENVEQVEQIEEIQEQPVEKIKTAKTKKSKKAENVQKIEENTQEQTENVEQQAEQVQVIEEQQVEKTKKPSLWQRFKNSKFVRTIKYVMKIRVVLDYPALPEGRGENN